MLRGGVRTVSQISERKDESRQQKMQRQRQHQIKKMMKKEEETYSKYRLSRTGILALAESALQLLPWPLSQSQEG